MCRQAILLNVVFRVLQYWFSGPWPTGGEPLSPEGFYDVKFFCKDIVSGFQ